MTPVILGCSQQTHPDQVPGVLVEMPQPLIAGDVGVELSVKSQPRVPVQCRQYFSRKTAVHTCK